MNPIVFSAIFFFIMVFIIVYVMTAKAPTPVTVYNTKAEKDTQITELAKKFMDKILYDCFFVNKYTPFVEKTHYGPWLNKLEETLKPLVETLGVDFFDDEVIATFSQGHEMACRKYIRQHECLQALTDVLNDYFIYLCNLPAFSENENYNQDKKLLTDYTMWLNKRGFFNDNLQCDFEHQIDTFLTQFSE